MKFLLYGANGHTAAFAIEYAKEQGINLILAGRSEESIKPVAEENGFDYRIFDLESNDNICKNIEDIDLVLNTGYRRMILLGFVIWKSLKRRNVV